MSSKNELNKTTLDLLKIKDIVKNNSQKFSVSNILSKICVSPPYFTFKEVYKYQDYLIAPISPEQPIINEKAIISIAEAGRHIAILGSCMDAITEKEKHYYLATNATMNFYNKGGSSNLYTIIKYAKSDKKVTTAFGFIVDENGELIYDLLVTYQKLKANLFYKIFSNYLRKTYPILDSPYKIIEVNDLGIVRNKFSITKNFTEFSQEEFAGYFDNYPMLPVSISAYMMCYMAGLLFFDINKQRKYYISYLDLEVMEAVSPEQTIQIRVNYDIENEIYICKMMDLETSSNLANMTLKLYGHS